MKKIVTRAMLIIMAIIVPITIGEVYLRRYNPQTTLERAQVFSFKCFEQGSFRWIKLKSNADCMLKSIIGAFPDVEVKTNTQGLRNRDIPLPKPTGEQRILFVGDSFTMGWGVNQDQAFPQFTEHLLNSLALPYHVETINAGFAAAGPSGYYIYIKNFGMQLDPDIVVVGFYLGNDITGRDDIEWMEKDAAGLPSVVRSKSSYVDAQGQLRLTNLAPEYRYPILNKSHLFIYLFNLLHPNMNSVPSANPTTPVSSLVCVYKSWCHSMDNEKNEVKQLFLGIKRVVMEEHHKKLLVVIIPAEFQVTDGTEPKYGIAVPLLPDDKATPNTEFGQFFAGNGIDYLDLLPSFQPFHDRVTYYPQDDHWNPIGHEIAGAAIATKIANDYFGK